MNLIASILLMSGFFAQDTIQISESVEDQSAKTLYEIGIEHAKQHNYLAAKEFFDLAILKDSTFVDAIFRRGLAFDNMGLTYEAIEEYTQAIKIEQRAVFFNNRAINKAILGFFDEAVYDYDEALKLDPDYCLAFINRGYAFVQLGRIKDACNDFIKAKQLDNFMAPRMIKTYCE